MAANIVGVILARLWELTMPERPVGFFAPGIAFIVVVTIANAIVGRERIVFYQTACGAIGLVAITALVAGAQITRLRRSHYLELGVFLVFGRIGCFAVACCHGTLGRGVTYGQTRLRLDSGRAGAVGLFGPYNSSRRP